MHLYFLKRKFIAISLFILLFVSCVTTKKKGDLSTVGKIYHNTTARYNGYFNANELYSATRERIIQQYQENYTKLLPIYPEMKVESPGNVAEDMDVAITKLGVVINLHRTSKWTDDSYLLIGKSQFLKQDYQKAKETFAYLIEEFDPDNLQSNNRKITSAKSEKAKKATNKNRRTTKKKKPKESNQGQKSRSQEIKDREKEIKQRDRARKKARKQANKERSSGKSTNTKTIAANSKPTAAENKNTKPASTNTPETGPSDSKDKKEEEKNDGLFSHQPAYYDGMIWLARTNILQGYHLNANNIFSELKSKPHVPQETLKELEKARTDAYVQLGITPML